MSIKKILQKKAKYFKIIPCFEYDTINILLKCQYAANHILSIPKNQISLKSQFKRVLLLTKDTLISSVNLCDSVNKVLYPQIFD